LQAPQVLPVRTNSRVVDIDGDARDDLWGNGGWWKSLGNGRFEQHPVSTACTPLGDLDGDGLTDVLCPQAANPHWQQGRGDGTFGPEFALTPARTLGANVRVPVDGGSLLFSSTTSWAGEYRFFSDGGSALEREQTFFVDGGLPSGYPPLVGDLDHDGTVDVIVSDYDQMQLLYARDGGFQLGASGFNGQMIGIAYLDDAGIDLAGDFVWRYRSDGGVGPSDVRHNGERVALVTDLDGDGRSDWVWGKQAVHVEIRLGGPNAPPLVIPMTYNDIPKPGQVADFDGTGRPGVVVGADGPQLVWIPQFCWGDGGR